MESERLSLIFTSIKIESGSGKFAIPLVANTRLSVLTTVSTGTKSCSLDLGLVLFNIFVQGQVFLNVLTDQNYITLTTQTLF